MTQYYLLPNDQSELIMIIRHYDDSLTLCKVEDEVVNSQPMPINADFLYYLNSLPQC